MKLRQPTPLLFWTSLATAALVLGCLGRSPQVRFYALSPVPGASVAGTSELAVGVGPLRLPRYLDRPQLATRTSGSQLEYDQTSRWAGGLETNMLRALGDDLGSRLGTGRIIVYPAPEPFPVQYRVSVEVLEFEALRGDDLVLRARWTVREHVGEHRSSSEESTVRRSIAGGGVESVIAAHDAAVGALADAIAARIAQLEREQPADTGGS